MKLEAVVGEEVFASSRRSVYRGRNHENLERYCSLPIRRETDDSFRRRIQTDYRSKSVISKLVGNYPTTNLWPIAENEWYATQGRHIYRSSDQGANWSHVHALPESSGPMGILPTGFCVSDDAIYAGEYPLSRNKKPRLLVRRDGEDQFHALLSVDARHIHSVQVDPFTDDIWLTTGDEDQECRIMRLADDSLEIVGQGSQHWRAVELAFTPSAVLWGMDCPYRDNNTIFRLDRQSIDGSQPSPEPVHELDSPIYYAATTEFDGNWIVAFSTTIEPHTEPSHRASVVSASDQDDYESWTTVVSYKGKSKLLSRIFPTNSYIFLQVIEDGLLLINPYNTERDDGVIIAADLRQVLSS